MARKPFIRVQGAGYDDVTPGAFGSFARYGLGDGPNLPGQITAWYIEVADGGYLLVIEALPDPGDAAYEGDGAGAILDLEWRADDGDGESLLGNVPSSWIVSPTDPGSIGVRALATAGYGPWADIIISASDDVANLLLESGGNKLLEAGGLHLLEEAA